MSIKKKVIPKIWFLSLIFICFFMIFDFTSLDANVPEDQIVQGETILWAETDISDPNVWVIINTPDCKEEKKILVFNQSRYETAYNFDYPGHYKVTTYIKDPNGQIYNAVTNYTAKDEYEPDDNPQQAPFVPVQDEINHIHNFHNANDEDWIILLFLKDGRGTHQIWIEKMEECDGNSSSIYQWDSNCPLMADLCYIDGNLVLDPDTHQPVFYQREYYNPSGSAIGYIHPFMIPHSDFYMIKFYYKCAEILPDKSTTYKIKKIWVPELYGVPTGHIWGYIMDKDGKDNKFVSGMIHFDTGDFNIPLPNDPSEGYYFGFDLQKGSYKVYASATCYQESQKYDIQVEKDSLTQLNIFLSKDQKDPNCKASGIPLPSGIAKTELIYHVPLHSGLNFFKFTGEDPNYNRDSLLKDVYQSLKIFYQETGSIFDVHMGVRGYDPNNRKWDGRFMIADQETHSFEGDTSTLHQDKTYLFHLDIQAPNHNLSQILLPFHCLITAPDTKAIDFYPGINLGELSIYSIGYNSFKILLEEPNLKEELSSILFYDAQKGSFQSYYKIFEKQSANIPRSKIKDGYVIFMTEAVHGWLP